MNRVLLCAALAAAQDYGDGGDEIQGAGDFGAGDFVDGGDSWGGSTPLEDGVAPLDGGSSWGGDQASEVDPSTSNNFLRGSKGDSGNYEGAKATDLDTMRLEVFVLVNRARKQNGVKPLCLNRALSKAAQRHSKGQQRCGTEAHNGCDGSTPQSRMKEAGYEAVNTGESGENIASNQRSAAEVMKDWMNSPGHRENILRSTYNNIGIGISSNWYWTQDFGFDKHGCDDTDFGKKTTNKKKEKTEQEKKTDNFHNGAKKQKGEGKDMKQKDTNGDGKQNINNEVHSKTHKDNTDVEQSGMKTENEEDQEKEPKKKCWLPTDTRSNYKWCSDNCVNGNESTCGGVCKSSNDASACDAAASQQ